MINIINIIIDAIANIIVRIVRQLNRSSKSSLVNEGNKERYYRCIEPIFSIECITKVYNVNVFDVLLSTYYDIIFERASTLEVS